jgi:hypothetical protein
MSEGALLFEQDKCAESVGRLLMESLPEPWTEAIVEVKFYEDSVNIVSVYKKPGSDVRHDTGYINGIDNAFWDYANAAGQPGDPRRPTSAHFTLTSSGQYGLTFGYDEKWEW